MKIDEEQDILWDQTLDRMFVTFSYILQRIFNSPVKHLSMSKRRHSATSENQPQFLPKRRNDFIEASIPISALRPFAFPVALHSDIVRLSWISSFLLPIHTSNRSFWGSQGVLGCESPSACRLRYLRRRLDRRVRLLLQGG